MEKKPEQLHVSIGGYTGPSYSVALASEGLVYNALSERYGDMDLQHIQVADEQWAAFRTALDDIDVWRWASDYPNPGVFDGTQWALEIVYADKEVRSSGSNSYPAHDGSASDVQGTRTFKRFLKAVQTLLGGRDFA